MFKRSILAPTHVIRDLRDANAETGWIPVEQTSRIEPRRNHPSGHHAPYSILAANASKKSRIEPSRNLARKQGFMGRAESRPSQVEI
jgi:hypothetical protein